MSLKNNGILDKREISKFLPLDLFSNTENKNFIIELIYMIKTKNYDIVKVLYCIALVLFEEKNLLHKKHIVSFLKDNEYTLIDEIIDMKIPKDEFNLLGIIYQTYISMESDRKFISWKNAKIMSENLDFSHGENILDPCCGTGTILLSLENISPDKIYAYDTDEICVLITKINLFLKFSNYTFEPKVFYNDFLKEKTGYKFHYIVTQPPCGVCKINKRYSKYINSTEIFSNFFLVACEHILKNGKILFLFPNSILKNRSHKDLRTFMLDTLSLKKIIMLDKLCMIENQISQKHNFIKIINNNKIASIHYNNYAIDENRNFIYLCPEEATIINTAFSIKKHSLENSKFVLGITTGDNKNLLKSQYEENLETVFSSNEISPFGISPSNTYLEYDRKKLKQVAKDEFNRADEKLVYKLISKKLIFAYDDKQRLFLSNVNILFPNISNMSIKTVMAFLNSWVLNLIYQKYFYDKKIFNKNLFTLPFPEISNEENILIENLVNDVLNGKSDQKLQLEICKIFGLSQELSDYLANYK